MMLLHTIEKLAAASHHSVNLTSLGIDDWRGRILDREFQQYAGTRDS